MLTPWPLPFPKSAITFPLGSTPTPNPGVGNDTELSIEEDAPLEVQRSSWYCVAVLVASTTYRVWRLPVLIDCEIASWIGVLSGVVKFPADDALPRLSTLIVPVLEPLKFAA